jgi:hypothetical protein
MNTYKVHKYNVATHITLKIIWLFPKTRKNMQAKHAHGLLSDPGTHTYTYIHTYKHAHDVSIYQIKIVLSTLSRMSHSRPIHYRL